ncbi:MAG: threonylcarbamoyl-AMP synthase [Proteobacteria bacterium]|nr:threonylcarbamoyl-AMP synthase [Pseudomonadota bacterium]
MRIELDEWASQGREVHKATTVLAKGGVLAIPTDSGYAFACDLNSGKAIERLYDLKQSPRSHPLSIILSDVDAIGRYTSYVSSLAYRTMKRLLPGPYTFILEAGPEIPKRMHKKRREIGIRVPMAEIPRRLAEELGRPLVCASVRTTNDEGEEMFVIDAVEIEDRYGPKLDAVVDGGRGLANPTTVVDLTGQPFEVLREGQGSVELF